MAYEYLTVLMRAKLSSYYSGRDYEECVSGFDSELGYGSFTGTRYRMREFVDKFPNIGFEIIAGDIQRV